MGGALLSVLTLVLLLVYRNWRYEQELDSLLWKVDYKDIQVNDPEQAAGKTNRVRCVLVSSTILVS